MFMRINIQKLDDRIKKLQEIRRIAADPELANIFLEFVGDDTVSEPVLGPKLEGISTSHVYDTQDLVKDVVSGASPEVRGGLWSRKAAGQ